jgi:SAM-dependent methyltransferase
VAVSSENRRLREYYEKEGRRGDQQAGFRKGIHHRVLSELIHAALYSCAPHTVLDVGCAEGMYAFSAARANTVAVGMDISETKLQRAASYAAKFEVADKAFFLSADGHHLPFGDDSFDMVICSQVLEHLSDPELAMRELARVAKRWVVVSVPVWSWLGPTGFGSPLRSRDYNLRKDGHIHWFTTGKLARIARRAGLDIQRIQPACIRYPFRRLLSTIPPIARLTSRLDRKLAGCGFLASAAYRAVFICSKHE